MIKQKLKQNIRQTIKRTKRPLATLVLFGAMATSLQGCIEMAMGSAVMGTLAATDRRTLGAQTEDKTIVVKGETRIPNLVGSQGHVNLSSFNRKVLVTGEVKDEATKAAVEREVAAIEGVQSVVNELGIMGTSSFTSRSNDSLITAKVKASFVDAKDLYANAIKVVTERSTVYLLGRVTQREGNRASEIAASISGVQRVVKVFEYISEEDLKVLTNVPQEKKAE